MNLEKIIAVRTSKVVYQDGNKAIKVFDKDYSKSDVLNEALNQARIEETGLNTPKVIEVTMYQGKWCIVTEFIEGKTLDQLMKENPAKYADYMEKFVDIQMKVQQKKSPLLVKIKDKMNRKISESSLDATTRYDLHTRLNSMPDHDKVCHGDFNPTNIIIKDDGSEYILDWSHATQGNASADAATTYLKFYHDRGREEAEKYLELFCKKSDTAKQYVQKWIPIVAAANLCTADDDEVEFLKSCIDVVDYE